jgi:trimeric autotransporter adhesin
VAANSGTAVPIAIPITGTANTGSGSLTLTPGSLSFTQFSVPQQIMVSNTSGSAVSIKSITVPPASFSESNTCGSSIAAGTSCAIAVSATAANTALGTPITSALTLSSSDTAGTQTVALSTSLPNSTLTLSANALTFPSTNVGTAAAAQTITLTNSGP